METNGLGGFRLLLALGAILAVAGGLLGLLAGPTLDSWLGLKGAPSPGFLAIARMFGAMSVAVASGYLLAAIDPSRQRSLLVVLLAAPLAMMLATLIGVIGGDLSSVRGSALTVFDLAYCLVYVRLYPRAAFRAAQSPELTTPPAA